MPALSGRRAAAMLAVLTAVFVMCTVITGLGGFDRLDHWVALVTHRTERHTTDVVLSLVALSASVPLSVAWLGLLGLAATADQHRRPRVAVLAVGLASASLVEVILKSFLHHPGPAGARTVLGLGIETFGSSSYPSGHMLRGTGLAAGTALLLRGGVRAGLLAAVLYTVVLAWTRIYLLEHWISDVAGGLLLGAGIAVVVAAAPPALWRR